MPTTAESPREGAERFDVVVIGAGVGGLCAAAKLAYAGRRVLVVEREPRVGGRASTERIDGFMLPTGGVALELGGPMERLARSVGAGYDVREPSPGVVVRIRGRSIDTSSRMMRLFVDKGLLRAGRWLTRNWQAPADPFAPSLTLDAALRRVTRSQAVLRLARNFAAGIFGLNSDEIPARVVATYLTQKGAFRRYGFCPRGTIGVLEDLASVVLRHGGEVWTSAVADSIEISRDGRRAEGVVVSRGSERLAIACRAVVSNAGPAATVAFVGAHLLPAGYVETISARDVPTPMIVIDIASQHPLVGAGGIVFFADTTRLSAIAHLTSCCPEVAPPGWYLYVAYSVPVPALGAFDGQAEIDVTLAELAAQLPGWSEARVLRVRLVSGDWPAQRSVAGREAPIETPIENLYNVGDGVRQYADAGTQSCAVTADLVSRRLANEAGAAKWWPAGRDTTL
jgi:phytoene desaturase